MDEAQPEAWYHADEIHLMLKDQFAGKGKTCLQLTPICMLKYMAAEVRARIKAIKAAGMWDDHGQIIPNKTIVIKISGDAGMYLGPSFNRYSELLN